MHGFLSARRTIVGLAVVAALVAVGFVSGRTAGPLASFAGGPDQNPVDQGTPSGPVLPPTADETPVPGATPDTTKPFWFIPYENQDRQAPKLQTTINGIEVGAAGGTDWQCPKPWTGKIDWRKETAGTAFEVNLAALPVGVKLTGEPRLAKCSDGRLLWFELALEASPGLTGVNTGGGEIFVSRVSGIRWWTQQAPAARWSAGEVAGRPAAILAPIVPNLGQAGVFVLDAETGGSTRIMSSSASLEFVRSIAEAIYK